MVADFGTRSDSQGMLGAYVISEGTPPSSRDTVRCAKTECFRSTLPLPVVVKGKCQGLLFSDYVSVAPRRSRYNGTLQSQAAIKHRSDPAAADGYPRAV